MNHVIKAIRGRRVMTTANQNTQITIWRPLTHRRKTRCLAVLASLGLALILLGCGDDDGEDEVAPAVTTAAPVATTAAPAATTAAPAATTAAPAATTAAPAATTAAPAGVPGAARAAEIVAQQSTRPTEINVDVPIVSEIPTDKTVYYVSCGAPACTEAGNVFKAAGEFLGWEVITLDTDGSPQGIADAFAQVVRAEPDGLYYKAVPRSQVGPYLEELDSLGAVVVNDSLTDPDTTAPVVWSGYTALQLVPNGEGMAAWVVNDSGAVTDVLYVDLPQFDNLAPMAEAFESTLAELCPACGHKKLDLALQDIVNLPDLVVSHLRANPETEYVISAVDSIGTGIPAALDAAGLTDVKLFGTGPGVQNLQLIASGQQAGSIVAPFWELSFEAADAMARAMVGEPVIPAGEPPLWLVTAETLPADISNFFPLVIDIVEKYQRLWNISAG
jgi:hypothetical protein